MDLLNRKEVGQDCTPVDYTNLHSLPSYAPTGQDCTPVDYTNLLSLLSYAPTGQDCTPIDYTNLLSLLSYAPTGQDCTPVGYTNLLALYHMHQHYACFKITECRCNHKSIILVYLVKGWTGCSNSHWFLYFSNRSIQNIVCWFPKHFSL